MKILMRVLSHIFFFLLASRWSKRCIAMRLPREANGFAFLALLNFGFLVTGVLGTLMPKQSSDLYPVLFSLVLVSYGTTGFMIEYKAFRLRSMWDSRKKSLLINKPC